MRIILSVLSIFILAACATTSNVKIAGGETATIQNTQFELSEITLQNKSLREVDVKVVDKETGEFIRGFGLGPAGKVEVIVEDFAELQLKNTGSRRQKVGYKINERPTVQNVGEQNRYISFYLTNKTRKSIPLIIPSVMNPNLSPNSQSGVDLKIGQKIFFKNRGKKYLLLEVSDAITENQKVEVSSLMKKRKVELGL